MNHSFSSISNGGKASTMNTISILVFLASLLFLLIVLTVGYRHRPPKSKYNFLNLAINPSGHQLKLYDGLEKIDSIASVYASRGMPGFYPYKVWDKLDSNMVPIVQYPFGNYRNPVNIAQTAIAFYNQYLKTGDAIERARFLNNINWLMRNHKSYYFRYEFRYQHAFAPVMEKGWISAMAQGQGLGALSVAFT